MALDTFYNVVNGQKRQSTKMAQSIDPTDRRSLWPVPVASDQDLEDAVAAAKQAFRNWSKTPVEHRKQLLSTFEEKLLASKNDLTQLLMQEGGKPHALAAFELNYAPLLFKHHRDLDINEQSEDLTDRSIVTRHVPLGVVAAICPWNFPLVLSIGKIIPALLTGCCVIVKPSPFAPYAILKMIELLHGIFPPGVLQVLNGDDALGPALVAHKDVPKISFTGSIQTGKKIVEKSALSLKRLTLELGGNDAAIVLPDVDIARVAKQVISGALINSGQMCLATKRVYIHDSIYETFVEAMVKAMDELIVGSPDSESSTHGPIQNPLQFVRVSDLLEDCEKRGYSIKIGRAMADELRKGLFVQPTLVDNPPETSRVVQEEAFGPVFPTLKWDNEQDVIRRVNAMDTGLGASIWSSDIEKAGEMARQLEVGSIWINTTELPIPQAMFGGHKQSGIGGEWGKDGWKAFCNVQIIHTMKSRDTKL
ncbi:hypothetical protein M409DRAFT_71676 [Zasmidium cellare ATCC 36951]|uniref:aldehyde dehydrogenase (NAD(+)) n=1 Tax=Zasmidium cellare ATCC 36951 TaxID=1080233 RepID=A0A6A6BUA3_ZASCE|nr:uncharacterized protein M409DRAFT_71676 [Zasmidium cellare ATCC 36951]KAF2158377.1 hypothetical protein M409DRAFT_71676 [Zasmidium cellare ATCC 36951]